MPHNSHSTNMCVLHKFQKQNVFFVERIINVWNYSTNGFQRT